MQKIGFDNQKYLDMQSEKIRERISKFGGKLYLEFGGKLFDDFHASRVLPGFKPDSKLQLLLKLKDQAEMVVVINSNAIEAAKVRGDLGITYDQDVFRLIDAYQEAGLYVGSVVLTRYEGQKSAKAFERKLKKQGVKTYHLYSIDNYPYDLEKIISDNGFGKNDYIETTRSLIVITAPGPGSGKLSVCLSQLYNDNKRGLKSGYAKFETFPIWNLPLKHPVNLAYEAATADLNDVNMIDPYHLEAYGISTVNYNRDIEAFPVLNRMFEKIYGHSPYKSPTDMGVNMAGNCISDDEVCCEASRQEIIRRYYRALCDRKQEKADDATVEKIDSLLKNNGICLEDRKCVLPARAKAEKENVAAGAMELADGTIVTGKTSRLLRAPAAMTLNALKYLAKIPDEVPILPQEILEPICSLKTDMLGGHNPRLHLDETLLALSISAVTNPLAKLALSKLPELRGCQAHSTVMLSQMDNGTIRKLGIDLTCDPAFETKKLYHGK